MTCIWAAPGNPFRFNTCTKTGGRGSEPNATNVAARRVRLDG